MVLFFNLIRIQLLGLLMLLSTISFSQIFIKGSFFKPPFVYEPTVSWSSIAGEYKYKMVGIEYQYKYFRAKGEGLYERMSNQVSLRYYFYNKPDTVSKFKFYISPLVYQTTNISESDYEGYEYRFHKGFGYGFLMGGKRKIYKHFGIESGIYWHYYDDKTYNYLDGHAVGLRLMIFFNS